MKKAILILLLSACCGCITLNTPEPTVEPPPVADPVTVTTEPTEPELPPSPVGSQTFLWKPISESSGKMVTLLPSRLNGIATGCFVENPDGSVAERGTFGGYHNGNRGHWRFTHPGADYGLNCKLVAQVASGVEKWNIANGANRYEQHSP